MAAVIRHHRGHGTGWLSDPVRAILAVEVLQDPNLNREVLVLPDGSVNFPFAGAVQAGGLTTGQVQAQIAQGIAPNFAVQPNVFVTVRQVGTNRCSALSAAARTIDVFYLGECERRPAWSRFRRAPRFCRGWRSVAGSPISRPPGVSSCAATNRHTGETSIVTLDYRALSRWRHSAQ
jgi:polysaccharide export outer membrane protein